MYLMGYNETKLGVWNPMGDSCQNFDRAFFSNISKSSRNLTHNYYQTPLILDHWGLIYADWTQYGFRSWCFILTLKTWSFGPGFLLIKDATCSPVILCPIG